VSLKPVSCNLLICDGCGAKAEGYEETFTIHFGSEKEAADWLTENEKDYVYAEAWLRRDDKDYCESCLRNLPHTFVQPGYEGRCYACDKPESDPVHLPNQHPDEPQEER
jgi:hypothetical protein